MQSERARFRQQNRFGGGFARGVRRCRDAARASRASGNSLGVARPVDFGRTREHDARHRFARPHVLAHGLRSNARFPSRWFRTCRAGDANDCGTNVCAARWKTTSGCAMSRAARNRSRVGEIERHEVAVSSRGPPHAKTTAPSRRSASTRYRPTNPLAPVTNARTPPSRVTPARVLPSGRDRPSPSSPPAVRRSLPAPSPACAWLCPDRR